MSRPRPSDHTPLPALGRLPLALGAAAVSLALAGCSHLPESLGGSAGEGGGDGAAEQADEAAHDPADAEGSIRTAVEHVETADDYDVFVLQEHESGDPFRGRAANQRYTNTPEETVHTRLSGEGMLNVMYYTGSGQSLRATSDGFYEVVTDPSPADRFMTDPAVGAASLSQIMGSSTDLAYGGEGEVDLEYSQPSEGEPGETVQETVPAHSYSGTFTSTVPEFAATAEAYSLELAEYPGAPFTLWLDEEGVPVLLEHTSGEYGYTHTFVGLNEGLELTMPAPGDPAFP